jgi:protein subunit release factor A
MDTPSLLLEIRAAEGGADAKLLVGEHLRAYQRAMDLEGV